MLTVAANVNYTRWQRRPTMHGRPFLNQMFINRQGHEFQKVTVTFQPAMIAEAG
jgi:hypothetical protein